MIGAVTQTLSAVDKEREWGIVPIAAPYYTPDTGWGIGAYVVSYIKPDKEAEFSKPDELWGVPIEIDPSTTGVMVAVDGTEMPLVEGY